MSVISRVGSVGVYYGTPFTSSSSLTQEQMEVNATFIYRYLSIRGWTINAICGMLGNIQAESSLNPGRWQSDDVENYSGGYGLVQWTPASKYTSWCGSSDPSTMDNNLERIIYELENGEQYYQTDEYPLSFIEFTKSADSPQYLAACFLKNYERAGVEVLELRQNYANNWYSYLTGVSPVVPINPTNNSKKNKGFNFLLFKRRKMIYGKR